MKSKTMWKRMGMLGLSTMMALSSFNIPIHANTLQGLSETARATEIRNVALDGTAEVSCITDDNGQLHGPEHINDGDVSTGSYWDSGISDEEVYAILDLKQDYTSRLAEAVRQRLWRNWRTLGRIQCHCQSAPWFRRHPGKQDFVAL